MENKELLEYLEKDLQRVNGILKTKETEKEPQQVYRDQKKDLQAKIRKLKQET